MFNYELDGKEAARIVFRKVRRFTSLRYSFPCFLRFHSPFTLAGFCAHDHFQSTVCSPFGNIDRIHRQVK